MVLKSYERAVLSALLVLLVVSVIVLVFTESWTDYRQRLQALQAVDAHTSALIDTRPIDTANQLAQLAATPTEQKYAEEAMRLGDHAVDLAFDAAMRDAAENPAPLTPQTRAINQRLTSAQANVSSDQAHIASLMRALTKSADADKAEIQDLLGIAQAQLSLDQDDLEDAQQDLIRAGGDKQALVQQLLDQHNSAEAHSNETDMMAQAVQTNSIETTKDPSILAQGRAWYSLYSKKKLLLQAQQQAQADAAALSKSHDDLEKQLVQEKSQQTILHGKSAIGSAPVPSSNPSNPGSPAALPESSGVSFIHSLAADQKRISDLDKSIEFEKQLAALYGDWITFASARQKAFLRVMFLSAAWIFGIALVALFANYALQHAFAGVSAERRRLHALRVMSLFVVQVVGVLLILFVIFGMPSNMATVLALAGAGLTVAMKDFIISFLGWFILMGRNGIRPGDWVEIEGVAGEVLEIGFLHTILLETGSWTDAGHPTGRKVSFVNSFAIEGHYFNFSTSGQWLWDEIEIQVPGALDPYSIAEAIQKIVTEETAANVKLAESEWRRVTPAQAIKSFSAAPALSVQPAADGVKILVRYVTRVNQRHEQRARLYRAVLDLLHRRDIPESAASIPSA